ncbi:MAG TPA: chemotaxis protein CheB [Polyangiaceae bacterium]|nr:chemotaxis protein CheB [Polyangiaceae bacterium]
MAFASTSSANTPSPGIVCLAASAGGLAALTAIISGFKAPLPAAMVVVQHRIPDQRSMLDRILSRASVMPVGVVADDARIAAGRVYVAPPNCHVLCATASRFRLVDGARIRHVCSSADPLFTSAAQVFGARTIAVVLTGYDSDGSDGARAIAAAGGRVVVQNPQTAEVGAMPRSALDATHSALALELDDIARFLERETAGWSGGP